jgi:hypothetical protein
MIPALQLPLSAILSIPFLVAGAPRAVAEDADPWRNWSTLHFRAKSGLFRGHVEMHLAQQGGQRSLETSTTASFIGLTLVRSTTRTTFEAATGRTSAYQSFSRKRGRRYEFGDDGYTVVKLRPAEEGNEAGAWQETATVEFPYPANGDGSPQRLHDYYGMLLHLHEEPLHSPGDEVVLQVATSDGPQPFVIRVAEERTGSRELTDLATGEERARTVRELRLTIVPADPESDEGFLKMKGETEVWVEAGSKTPIEIGGRIPRVGEVRLLLIGIG